MVEKMILRRLRVIHREETRKFQLVVGKGYVRFNALIEIITDKADRCYHEFSTLLFLLFIFLLF